MEKVTKFELMRRLDTAVRIGIRGMRNHQAGAGVGLIEDRIKSLKSLADVFIPCDISCEYQDTGPHEVIESTPLEHQ